MRAHVAHHDRVAVRICACSAGDAGGAASAGDVFDDDRLAQRARHRLSDDAGDDVRGAAGGEGHDHGDGLVGIGRRLGCGTG